MPVKSGSKARNVVDSKHCFNPKWVLFPSPKVENIYLAMKVKTVLLKNRHGKNGYDFMHQLSKKNISQCIKSLQE